MTYTMLKNAIYNALEREENYHKNGDVRWEYVDADAYADVRSFFKSDELFYEYFNDIVDGIIDELAKLTPAKLHVIAFQHKLL